MEEKTISDLQFFPSTSFLFPKSVVQGASSQILFSNKVFRFHTKKLSSSSLLSTLDINYLRSNQSERETHNLIFCYQIDMSSNYYMQNWPSSESLGFLAEAM